MRFHPTSNRVYIVLDPKDTYTVDEKTGMRVLLGDNAAQQTRIGTVEAVGPLVDEYEPGDRVAIAFYAGMYIHLPAKHYRNELHRVVAEHEIVAKVSSEDVRHPELEFATLSEGDDGA